MTNRATRDHTRRELAGVPAIRIQAVNACPLRADGEFVLYWMTAFRRLQWNYSLDRAIAWAVDLAKPLVVFEPLRIGYRWASDRLHRFVLDGMADNGAQMRVARSGGVLYFPYVEPQRDADKGLLAALADRACVVVTDDYPAFFLPRMIAAAAAKMPVRLEKVDSNGLFPLRATERIFTTAFSFRAFLQKELPPHLEAAPQSEPLAKLKLPRLEMLPTEITDRWPAATARLLDGNTAELAALAIDHSVEPVEYRGGAKAAERELRQFLERRLSNYATSANQPDEAARSQLSPYLHFGHVSAHQAFHELMEQEEWSPDRLGDKPRGRRAGWWGVSESAEVWLDELITWRELGYNMAAHSELYDQYESLPDWAQTSLDKHARDRREFVYTLDEFARGATHDPLWNAAQNQLVCEGRIHNYLRMLWGKKILEWTPSPRDALETMIELNNRYAVDGRDPNSYSGILWCLGRYDRAWGPERPIFGKVRYMSSESTRRKLHLADYLHRFGNESSQLEPAD